MTPGGVRTVLACNEATDLQFPFPFNSKETLGSRFVPSGFISGTEQFLFDNLWTFFHE